MTNVFPFVSAAAIYAINDDSYNLAQIQKILECQCKSFQAFNSTDFLPEFGSITQPPDVILLILSDIHSCYKACNELKSLPIMANSTIILLLENNAASEVQVDFSYGMADCLFLPIPSAVLLARLNSILELKHLKAGVDGQGQSTAAAVALLDVQNVLIQAMAYLSETRDSISGNHVKRIQGYVKTLADKLRAHPRFVRLFEDKDFVFEVFCKTAVLHDVGNVGIPDRILLKPGRLTSEEFEVIKKHTEMGRDIIARAEYDYGIEIPFLKYVKEGAYSHHENWDGTGYPEGLAGDEIPCSARIMAVADVYDALMTRRVYRPALTHKEAIKVILEGKNARFDPDVVDAFNQVHEEFEGIAYEYRDSDQDYKKRIEYLENALAIDP